MRIYLFRHIVFFSVPFINQYTYKKMFTSILTLILFYVNVPYLQYVSPSMIDHNKNVPILDIKKLLSRS
jgi:hypothetical protein